MFLLLTVQDGPVVGQVEKIELADLPSALVTGRKGGVDSAPMAVGHMTLDEMEKWAIGRALEQSSQNQVRAAKLLGVSRDTLRYRMKKFGLLEDAPR